MSVAVIGDVMLDEFVYGDVTRISPESASPVLKVTRIVRNLGGAGNVARGVAALSCDCELIGVIGDDTAGTQICREHWHPHLTASLHCDPTRPTTVKSRYVSEVHASHLLRVDNEVAEPLSNSDVIRRLAVNVHHAIEDADVTVLSDYCKGVISPVAAEMWTQMALRNHCFVIVDTKGGVKPYCGADCLKVNLSELVAATGGIPIESDDDIAGAAIGLAARFDFGHVVVTMGERGLATFCKDARLFIEGKSVRVRDVSGAGDSVVATLAALISQGIDFETAIERANTAASIAVSKPGTSAVSLAELRGDTVIAPADDWSLLDQRLNEWQNLKIGFTNGCFDMLHPGHVHLLRECKRHCDMLIVGLNSDASVRALKGEDRPVQKVEDRAQMLAALEEVGLVVIFDGDDDQLIRRVRPHVIFKGDDYNFDNIAGSQHADHVILIPRLRDGLSTTDTINKIRSAA